MLRQDKFVEDGAAFWRAHWSRFTRALAGERTRVRKSWRKNRWIVLTVVPGIGLAFFIARPGG